MSIKVEFKKTKAFLVCIDSDGCVMESMNRKHIDCFGPKILEEWNLEQNREELLFLWNQINLFQKTRGINRFQGLSLFFTKIAQQGIEIEGRHALARWCERTSSLSNESLRKEVIQTQNECLIHALSWSNKVNEAINQLEKTDCVFQNAKEAMESIYKVADIAIVSSANREAVSEEWHRLGCMKYVSILCGQEVGTKSLCIQELKHYYKKGHVMMVGDAISDMSAAISNEVAFYPILAGHEVTSWKRLDDEALNRFICGEFTEVYQEDLAHEMNSNLN